MKLELMKVDVKSVGWGDRTEVLKDGTLKVNKEEFLAHVADGENLKSIGAEIALPGESVRITPVKDVIQPRYKVEGSGQVFPGMISDVESVGDGKTFVLEGAAVVTCGRIVGFQEGIIDMSGKGAEYTPFSKTCNIVLVFEPKEGLEKHDYEKACRIAGLKAAMFLAKSAYESGHGADRSESYEIAPFADSMKSFPGLPKVAYLYRSEEHTSELQSRT